MGIEAPGGGGGLFLCRDERWISFVIPLGAPPLWTAFRAWMGEEGLGEPIAGPEWDDPRHRAANSSVLKEVLTRLAAKYDRAELFHAGQQRRMLVMPVNNTRDLVEDAHPRHSNYCRAVEHPHLGVALTDAGAPYALSGTPLPPRRPAPALGEHNEELLAELAAAEPSQGRAAANGTNGASSRARPGLPLAGLRVADFCWMIAGPATTRILADFGATVTKIESEARMDSIRTIGIQPPGSSSVSSLL